MNPSVAFTCKCCGEPASPINSYGGLTGFDDCIEWLAPTPGPDPARPLLLEQAPGWGKEHRLAVRFPFHATSDETFWCLFKPPRSHFNGWQDCPEEIAHSSLIECRLLEVSDMEVTTASVRVEVERDLPMKEIGGVLPIVEEPTAWFDWMGYDRTWMARSELFTHLSWNLEGDAGCWAVIERRNESQYLILHGDWSWHSSLFHAANHRVSERTLEAMQRIEERKPQ